MRSGMGCRTPISRTHTHVCVSSHTWDSTANPTAT